MLGIDTCLAEVMSIPGALDAMLVDHTSGMAVAFSSASGVGGPVHLSPGQGDGADAQAVEA
ncbi:hypothetical protein AB0M50_38945, partial [Nonomuraea fuscirosea]